MQTVKHWVMSAWENSRRFPTPPLVSPREITSEKRLQKCFTTQIWVVILTVRTATEICFSQSEALPDLSSVWDYYNRFSDGISRGNQSGGVPKCRLFVQAKAVHVISLLSLKIFHLHFFAWLRNYLSFYLFFFFAIDRKQLKLALCRIDSAMQQSGSLNQPPPRFDTLIRSSSMSGKTKKTTCQLLNFEKQSKSMHS